MLARAAGSFLRPGSVVSPLLSVARGLEALALRGLAERYRRLSTASRATATIGPPEQWRDHLLSPGWRSTLVVLLSPGALAALEWGIRWGPDSPCQAADRRGCSRRKIGICG